MQQDAVAAEEEEEEEANLVQTGPKGDRFVYDYGANHSAVDTEFVMGDAQGAGIETVAAPPFEISAQVPESHEEGGSVALQGPHGPIQVALGPDMKPGSSFRFRCVPRAEFRIEVPPGAQPEKGLQIGVRRKDGIQVAIDVPPHLKPGDLFEVLPPALMVRVPDGAEAGDFVVFRPATAPGVNVNKQATSWLRAQVPEAAEPGVYFAVRMPLPKGVSNIEWLRQGVAGLFRRAPTAADGGVPLLQSGEADVVE